jgi:hypothetical protein
MGYPSWDGESSIPVSPQKENVRGMIKGFGIL